MQGKFSSKLEAPADLNEEKKQKKWCLVPGTTIETMNDARERLMSAGAAWMSDEQLL